MPKQYMAIDQYGQTYHGLGAHPRKALLERFDSKHASRMYQDTAEGPKHIGYVIRGHWLTIYEVSPVEWPA